MHDTSLINSDSAAERAYVRLREMAMMYLFEPGQPLKEQELARRLEVSRTPLREALNRLASEGFLEFESKRGFRCRPLEIKEVFDLYELRRELETAGVLLACRRADDQSILDIETFCASEGAKRFADGPMRQLDVDEEFHERLAALSGNRQLVRTLNNVNARIRFVRWIDMDGRLFDTDGEHRAIVAALKSRSDTRCRTLLESHIGRRMDQIRDVIKEGYARIYLERNDSLQTEKERK